MLAPEEIAAELQRQLDAANNNASNFEQQLNQTKEKLASLQKELKDKQDTISALQKQASEEQDALEILKTQRDELTAKLQASTNSAKQDASANLFRIELSDDFTTYSDSQRHKMKSLELKLHTQEDIQEKEAAKFRVCTRIEVFSC